jgi:hypothetical protein
MCVVWQTVLSFLDFLQTVIGRIGRIGKLRAHGIKVPSAIRLASLTIGPIRTHAIEREDTTSINRDPAQFRCPGMVKAERTSWPCKAGSYRKAEFWMAADFDAPMDDLKEYME